MVITDECLSMLIVGISMLFLALTIFVGVIKESFKYGFNGICVIDITLIFLSLVLLITGIILIMMGTGVLIVV